MADEIVIRWTHLLYTYLHYFTSVSDRSMPMADEQCPMRWLEDCCSGKQQVYVTAWLSESMSC
jgi:hypothetical protein